MKNETAPNDRPLRGGAFILPEPPQLEYEVARRSGRFRSLDILRDITAAVVVLSHLVAFGLASRNGLSIDILRALGAPAVDVFMVLSGYVVTHAWIRQADRAGRITDFYQGRLLRLMPVYAASFVIAVGCWSIVMLTGPHPGGPLNAMAKPLDPALIQANLIPLWRNEGALILNPPWWTLQVEFWAMLITPFVVRAASNAGHIAILSWQLLIGIGTITLAAFGITSASQNFLLISVVAGIWLALREDDEDPALIDKLGATSSLVIGSLVASSSLYLIAMGIDVFVTRLVGMIAALFIVSGVRRMAGLRPGHSRTGDEAGRLSYPLYVIHYPIIAAACALGAHYAPGGGSLLHAALGAALALALAWILGGTVERRARATAGAFISKRLSRT